MERLDKILSTRTSFSRKDAKKLISSGKVLVNGKAETSPEYKANEDDEIIVDGKNINKNEHAYIVLNKPAGYISATDDPDRETVLKLVPERLFRKGLFPAGRLDKDTTGLMIITDDGDFAHRILAPRKHVPKSYSVTIDIPVTEEMVSGFEKGVKLIDGICKTSKLTITGENSCTVVLSEGRYHQIKRMFGCYGAKVIKLHRLSIGDFYLPDDLASGECRELTPSELLLIEKGR